MFPMKNLNVNPMDNYDIIIIGAGPGGLAAGLYAARRKLRTLILSENLGGQMCLAHVVENYPGLEPISGMALAEKMKAQTEKAGCEIRMEAAVSMDIKGDVKTVKTRQGEYSAKALIIATGSHYKKLEAKGEDKFIGKGVSYCSICDGPLFQGKKVAVIGGSDSAVKSAIYLSSIAKETYLVHRRDQLRAEETNQEKMKASGVKMVWNSVVESIEGDSVVRKLILKDVNTNKTQELPIDGVFIEVGEIPTTELMKSAGIDVNEKNFIKVNGKYETSISGVYAVGDVTGALAQIITAAAGGADAATNAYLFIKGGFYGSKAPLDYGAKK
jgi:thioredoxin reductase (NADPH)